MTKLKKVVPEKEVKAEQNTVSILDQLKVKTKDFKASQIKEEEKEDIISLHISQIEFNPKNDYPKSEKDKIKDSILQVGLQQFPAVYWLEKEDRYILETGEQRLTAVQELIDTYKNWEGNPEDKNYKLYKKNVKRYEKKISCKINYPDEDLTDEKNEALSEARLIITNEIRRDSDPVSTAAKVNRLNELYEIAGVKNKGKKIAEDLKITDRQVYKYRAVDKLATEAKSLFESKKIDLNQAEALSKLDEEDQKALAQALNSEPDLNNKQIAELIRKQSSLSKELKKKTDQLNEIESSSKTDKEVIDSLKADIQKLKSQKEEVKKYDTAQKDYIILESRIKRLVSEYEKLEKEVNVYIEKNNGSNEAKQIQDMIKNILNN